VLDSPPGRQGKAMGRQLAAALYVVAMVAVVVGVDVLFFRNHFLARLLSNIGIVLVFAAFYLRFLKHR
jgi:1,4-dihydroxy-2-naphthoate octaprenyltransferase